MYHLLFIVYIYKNYLIDIQYTPILSVLEEYGADNVTVTVEWVLAQAGVIYSFRISPLVPIMFTGRSSLQMTILYNTVYTLSVVATAVCRPNATTFITLNYGEVYYIHTTTKSDLYYYIIMLQYFI